MVSRSVVTDWEESLLEAVHLRPTHLSCYSLIVEEGTPFELQEQGLLHEADNDLQAQMYDKTRSILGNRGYIHYEISNFCRPQYEAVHNLLYWRNRPFLGLGSGAAGYLNRMRYTNIAHIDKYIEDGRMDAHSTLIVKSLSRRRNG